MDHQDHVYLLENGVPESDAGVWADFGSGRGAFTLALAELLGPDVVIYAVDKDRQALRQLERRMNSHFPNVTLHLHPDDFTHPLDLPTLDGIVMANALHFVQEKAPVVRQLRGYLKPEGRLLLVEYNTDRGNHWVPHPLSYPNWTALAKQCGFIHTQKLAFRPSRFLGEIYSALSR